MGKKMRSVIAETKKHKWQKQDKRDKAQKSIDSLDKFFHVSTKPYAYN